jgi:hypothetical protein
MSCDAFNAELQKFFKHCQHIISTKDAIKMVAETSGKNIVLEHLNKYIKAAEKSKVEFMRDEFWTFFLKYAKAILKGHHRHTWLSGPQMDISLAYGLSTNTAKSNKIKIHLSILYRQAVQIQEETEERLDGLPETDEMRQKQELIYPEIFMLHFYRLFREAAKSYLPEAKETKTELKIAGQTLPLAEIKKYHAQLSALVLAIEKELGMKPNADAEESFSSVGLVGMAASLAKQIGIPIPQDAEMPNEMQAVGVMKDLFNQPEAKQLITDMQECKDPQQLLQKMTARLNDPKLAQAIQTSLGSTLKGAAEAPKSEAPKSEASKSAKTETPKKEVCQDELCVVTE